MTRAPSFLSRCATPFHWAQELFNPPPRDEMTLAQKIGRVLLVATALIVFCVLSSLILALALYAIALVPRLWRHPAGIAWGHALVIVAVSGLVNAACVLALLRIRKLDRTLLEGPPARNPRAP